MVILHGYLGRGVCPDGGTGGDTRLFVVSSFVGENYHPANVVAGGFVSDVFHWHLYLVRGPEMKTPEEARKMVTSAVTEEVKRMLT